MSEIIIESVSSTVIYYIPIEEYCELKIIIIIIIIIIIFELFFCKKNTS